MGDERERRNNAEITFALFDVDVVVSDSREGDGERAGGTRMLAINVSIPNLTVARRGETIQ